MNSLKRFFQSIASRTLALALALSAPLAISAADTGKTFATPEEAVAALVAAASARRYQRPPRHLWPGGGGSGEPGSRSGHQ